MSELAEAAEPIVEALVAGEHPEENFRRLFELYYSMVYHFFAKRGFSPDECLDLTQETFLGIYGSIGSFRREAPFETWLFRIAANVYRKRLRRQSASKRSGQEVCLESDAELARAALEDRAAGDLPRGPNGDVLRKERSRLLREAIEALPDQMRKCLILRCYRELKYREIAEVLRLSPDTVKAHLFQARQRLKESLGEYFEEPIGTGEEAS